MGLKLRTFQTWEAGVALTSRENYERIAAFYSEVLGENITCNQILFGEDFDEELVDLIELRLELQRDFEERFAELREDLRIELGLSKRAQ